MTKFLGIDVGGNHIKAAVINTEGEISAFESFDTADILTGFMNKFGNVVTHCLKLDKSVTTVGIGLPGTLDKTRKIPMEVPSIPELNGVHYYEILSTRFPDITFRIENDANAATLGEYKFSHDPLPSSLIMITMGTGIGGGAIIDGKIFNGGDGNAFEPGDMPSRNGKILEANIGKAGINEMLVKALGVDLATTNQPKDSIIAAKNGDVRSQKVFFEVGQILGESLLSVIRIVDIKTILIGGGISAAFEFIAPGVMDVLDANLTPYFKQGLSLRKASLGNDAGVLGAASLCF
jgi:glucokinase